MKPLFLIILLVLFSTNIAAQNQSNTVVDENGNGLIDINNLETLNAIRYQPDGTSYKATAGATGITDGCPNNVCIGYELMDDLDFNDDESYSSTANKIIWTMGAGWRPIGTSSNAFTGKFEGNGFTISNLRIDRSGTRQAGLFGYAGNGAEIANIGLLNVNIIGSFNVGGLVGFNRDGTITNSYATGSVSGNRDVGVLVGDNEGTITNSYAMGSTSGNRDVGVLVGENSGGGKILNSYATGSASGNRDVGGLVGFNRNGIIMNSYATGSVSGDDRDVGGLVGWNRGAIMNSYAIGFVSGDVRVGILVGFNRNGTITNSYATGSVSGDSDVGGLVGFNWDSTITNGYATGSVSGNSDVGGLVGDNRNGTITNSYWDVNTSGIQISAGGTSKTTVELKAARAQDTDPDKPYYEWSTTNWDFGTGSQYPILKYTDNPNTNSSECRSESDTTTDLPVCDSLLSPALRYGLSELQLVEGDLSPDFDVVVLSYRGTVVSSASTIQFRPITVNPNAKVYITANEETRGIAIDSGDESGMISLNTGGITTITIEVENGGETTQIVIYTLSLNYYEFNGDVDRDDDGLIEIDNLEELNAMRYQPDGTGYRESETAPKVTVGCPNNGCRGYELARDLDFNDTDSYGFVANRTIWTTGAGWQPIGASSNVFTGEFEGNGFTISKLRIDRSGTSEIGLFGYTGSRAEIANVGLLNVDIMGASNVGGLVGSNDGAIKNSYATGDVSGIGDFPSVGGLVGFNRTGTVTNSYATGSVSGNVRVGGLVGFNRDGTITNSYATSSVSGNSDVGGLVGDNQDGTITNSYATGDVSGSSDVGGLVGANFNGTIMNSYATGSVSGNSDVGGLVGWNFNGTITNSYATGSVSGNSDVGGLVGDNRNGTITNSYWDVNTSGIQISAGGTSKTTVELKAARAQDTDPDKPYYEWSTTNWDFGTGSQYPILKYTDNPNTDRSECHSVSGTTTDLPVCGSLLSPILIYGLSELQLVEGNLSPDFDVLVSSYRGTVVSSASTIQFRPITLNPDAKVYITANEEARGIAMDSGDESGMISLNTGGITTITIEIENDGETTQTVRYTLYLNYYEFNGDVDKDDDGLIEIDNLEELNAMRYQPDGTGYRESEKAPMVTAGCPNNGCRGYELTRDLDFNDADSYGSVANRTIWTTGAGWQPIGDSFNVFTGEFEGNGFTISNLMINRSGTSNIGLFGYTGSGAEITNIGLLNVDIMGASNVGGLVGRNDDGTIMNGYATGSVSGDHRVGGLVGSNDGAITNSYAMGSVSGVTNTGGLVGFNDANITNSYAMGSVSGRNRVGGLVGRNDDGTIMNSYATSSVSGDSGVGGLVGTNRNGTITNSYWDITTGGIQTSAGGTSKTTVELTAESAQDTDPDKPYYEWSTTNWDFGTGSQYPILKYTDNPNTDSSECRSASDTTTDLPVCDSLLSPALRYGLSELQLVEGNLSPDFDVVVPSYRGTVVSSASTIQFRPITVNPDAKVYITANEQTRGMAINSGDESGMISLNTGGITTITIEVENGGETTQIVIYTLSLNYYEFNGDVDRDDDGLIEIDNLEELNAMRYQPDGTGYRESETAPKVTVGCRNNGCRGYELTRDLDFNGADSYGSVANRTIWTTGAGWQPIGASSFNALSGQFEGNGHTISNLRIDRSGTSEIGLFGYTGSRAEITDVGLLNVDIMGTSNVGSLVGWNRGTIMNSYATGSVSGDARVGGLVGDNRNGTITNSHATISVSGNSDVGGLVGWNFNGTITNSYATSSVSGDVRVGGLVGDNQDGTITNSYATGSVSGNNVLGGLVGDNQGGTIMSSYATGSVSSDGQEVGGLVGWNFNGIITNSYATGSVSGNNILGGLVGWNFNGTIANSYATGSISGNSDVGGLVGWNFNGTVANSYATGSVSGNSDVGGLVGDNQDGTVTNSYWDVNTGGIQTSAGGTSKTTVELTAESAQDTDPDKPYYEWSTTNWDFGTGSQYPILKYTDNPNTDSSECRSASDTTTDLSVCDSLLSPALRYGLSELQLVEGNLSPDFNVVVPSYRGTVVSSASTIRFRPITVNPDAKVYITVNEEAIGIAMDSGDESTMISLNTDGITTITMVVENGSKTTQTIVYTLSLNYYEFNGDVDKDDDGLIEIDNLEELNAMRYQPDGTGYRESEKAHKVAVGCPNNICKGYELTRDLDFNDADSYSSIAHKITWTMGAGWQPVGESFFNAFKGKFEGNGFTISNLRIDRNGMSQIGLFGSTGIGAEITNVGLLNVNIIGSFDVGGLVGSNDGTIMNSYVTGSVSGRDRVGGLVGSNDGIIMNCYVTGSVSGRDRVGGLVGSNDGIIMNCYATGSVSGNSNVGGLVGRNDNGTITNSYWDVNTSGIQASAGGEGKTTRALQELTRATGIYRGWSDEVWDFGTTKQYPALKYSDGTVILNQGRMPVSIRINVRVFLEGFMPEHKN